MAPVEETFRKEVMKFISEQKVALALSFAIIGSSRRPAQVLIPSLCTKIPMISFAPMLLLYACAKLFQWTKGFMFRHKPGNYRTVFKEYLFKLTEGTMPVWLGFELLFYFYFLYKRWSLGKKAARIDHVIPDRCEELE